VAIAAASVCGASLVALGTWLWMLGRRINRAGCFPPPGAKVVRDTQVRTGQRACNMANVAQAGAFLFIVAGTVGAWYVCSRILTLIQP